MTKLLNISPIVPVRNVSNTIGFFRTILGFDVIFSSVDYAHLQRDSVSIKLQNQGEGIGESACYIDVVDIDDLYAELKPMLDTLPSKQVREPFNQNYGMREFHVKDLDNLLIFFGEAIEL